MGNSIDPANVLSSPAILSNDGVFTIYDVSVSCTGPGTILEHDGNTVFPAVSLLHGVSTVSKIGRGEKVAINGICQIPGMLHPISVEAVVRVDFRPLFLPRDHREFTIKSLPSGGYEAKPSAGSEHNGVDTWQVDF